MGLGYIFPDPFLKLYHVKRCTNYTSICVERGDDVVRQFLLPMQSKSEPFGVRLAGERVVAGFFGLWEDKKREGRP